MVTRLDKHLQGEDNLPMTMNQEVEAEVAFNEVKEHWASRRATVKQVARFLGVPQVDIARVLHMSRQTLNTRLNGTTNFEPWEIAAIAAYLGVDRKVMELSPDAAVMQIIQEREGDPRIRWSPRYSQRAA